MDSNLLRKVAGKFATGVTVVTTLDDKQKIHGLTVNSFVSISLSPALVGFSLMDSGNFLSLIQKGKEIGINILSANQKETSNRFAGLESNQLNSDSFEIKHNCPILSNCIGWYAVRVENLIPIGDHIFVVCEVIDLEASDENPLIYYAGYKSIGNSI